MSDAGAASWQALFDEYHRIVRGAGEMLRDADRLMAHRGYVSAHPQNTAGSDGSLHMDSPEKWAMGWFVRFYKSDAAPGVFPYVAVFLHDRGGTEDFPKKGTRLREPLVVAGLVRSAGPETCTWYYWHAKYWFWTGGEPNGPVVVKNFDLGNKDRQASNESFAVRLEGIKGLADLERVVVDPLVSRVT